MNVARFYGMYRFIKLPKLREFNLNNKIIQQLIYNHGKNIFLLYICEIDVDECTNSVNILLSRFLFLSTTQDIFIAPGNEKEKMRF